jgi:plastocyanin
MKQILIISSILSSLLFGMNHVVDQKGKTFIPHSITVSVGDTITFKNSDPFVHNAYTDNKKNEFDIGMQQPGSDAVVKIKAAGKFNIECAIHPNMLLEVTAE